MEPFVDALRSASPGGHRAREWSIYRSALRRIGIGTKDRETGNVHAPLSLSESVSARFLIVWDDGRVSRGVLERRQLEVDPESALAESRQAAYDDPDAAVVLGPTDYPEVDLFDSETAEAADGNVSPIAERLEIVRRVAESGRFRTWSGSFQAASGDATLVTSAGLDVRGTGTSAHWFASLDGELGAGNGARRFEPVEVVERRMRRLEELVVHLGTPSGATAGGERSVIFHPDVVEAYVLPALLHNLDGMTVDHGDGAFSAARFGDGVPVFHERLTLRLDPLRPFRLGSYRFGVEGLPAAECTYVDRGRLVTPILDLKYARRLDRPPTPSPYALDALVLEGPPELSEEEALAEAAGGALVLHVLGVHTQDMTSGDFSLSAPQTLELVGGGIGGRMRATISGNVFEVLRQDGLRLVRFRDETAPGLLVRCRVDPR